MLILCVDLTVATWPDEIVLLGVCHWHLNVWIPYSTEEEFSIYSLIPQFYFLEEMSVTSLLWLLPVHAFKKFFN